MTDNTAREGSQILGATEEASEFANLLLQEFKPKTERAREAVETAVRTLAEQALAQTDLVSNDAIKSIESIIAAIDAKLTYQDGQVAGQQTANVKAEDAGTTNVEFTKATPWPTGKYKVDVTVNGVAAGMTQEIEVK